MNYEEHIDTKDEFKAKLDNSFERKIRAAYLAGYRTGYENKGNPSLTQYPAIPVAEYDTWVWKEGQNK